jgi:hypothetical protein
LSGNVEQNKKCFSFNISILKVLEKSDKFIKSWRGAKLNNLRTSFVASLN